MNSKTTESKPVSRAMANTIVQAKLNISRPGDRYEVEADRAAAQVMNNIEGGSKSGKISPAGVEVSRLQNHSSTAQRQCCEEEEEEIQTKLQRQPEEEEEEMQTKLQRQPEEEEEEMQMKVQRQMDQKEEEEEEMQARLQRQPEEEEEDVQMKVQRQPDEEDPLLAKSDSGSESTHQAQSHIESRIHERKGSGQPLDTPVKSEMENGFGADFSEVRIHRDAEASGMSADVNAQAFTTGNDIYFNEGKYQPESSGGKNLLAHELTHVIQQNGGSQDLSRKSAAGEPVNEPPVKDTPGNATQEKYISGKAETDIQREVGDTPDAGPTGTEPADAGPDDSGPVDAGPAEDTVPAEETNDADNPCAEQDSEDSGDDAPSEDGGEHPEPAEPTLNLTPGNTLDRGEDLEAAIDFQPNGCETCRVTRWRFTTAEHGTVNRPTSESDFQEKWEGTMAESGTLEMTYRITPEGEEEGPEVTLSEEITVDDRTGEEWESEVDEQNEEPFSAAPSPPTRFRHLGHHQANITNPDPDLETISNGPNKNFRFVKDLAAGTYTSTPQIHPDLLNNTSDFYTFHLNAGILYLVEGDTETEIPRTEYSNLVIGENNISFDVPDWEAFYKNHDIVRVVATTEDESESYVVPESDWELDDNAEDAGVNLTNETAVRNGLGIGPGDAFRFGMETLKTYNAIKLMQAPDILTGTRSHEYAHHTHSHRANFVKMMQALDPERKIEKKVSAPGHTVNFNRLLTTWQNEILAPDHEIVDEAESEEQEEFIAVDGETMAGINTDPDTGDNLGAIWNISSDRQMGN